MKIYLFLNIIKENINYRKSLLNDISDNNGRGTWGKRQFSSKVSIKKNYKIIRLYRCIQGRFEVINSICKISDG